ncbi:MAG TPA: SGNH/GDSL hydrolase family protein [Caulobacteraceae bacterium]|jgi:lysophospholipase L1-like esterase
MNRTVASIFSGLAALAPAFVATTSQSATPGAWITVWAASPQTADSDDPLAKIDAQTVRERVRVSAGGSRLRIRLSNAFGSTPIVVGAISIALPTSAADVQADSIKTLTFRGRRQVNLTPGMAILSDPVDFPLNPGAEVSVSLYFPQAAGTATQHALALKRAVISPRGDFTGHAHIDSQTTSESSTLIDAVLVPSHRRQRLLVALGDSITDGAGSTTDSDRSWPNDLARRLIELSPHGAKFAVVNEGISGNQLLHDGIGVSALARFDRDVLSLPGVTHAIVLEGINDIGWPGAILNGQLLSPASSEPTIQDLIRGYRQLIARAHARHVKLIGATLPPFEGVTVPGYYSEAKETKRLAVNQWIRTSGAFDGVVDFDAALRDPEHPSRLQARYASQDHLHPNDAGYQAMADAVDVKLLR